ncbi:metal-dependent hydrolase [Spirosoma sp. RP8]|uniref:Metal-dependent hydrolase n=1 Tax=Spirosoma liriopis TaxID=2937440 RepID=A0ABT0HUJ0_9BACT|nr:metal-dependent hydrolase [Spirosoma liriopis]MCK8495855.1 metal-dependent hydrolase [Spirosoma liriopis]
MQSFNHVAGGFAFAGIFASFADINIFDRFDTMAVVWVAAVLPDVDHTKSISGKVLYPLSKWLQTHYGHRTVTHSIFFFSAVVVLCKGFDNLFHQAFTLPVALALGSHLIFDMCTKQGIPIFYPFSRRPAVLPANPKLRLSANDFRSEAILFLIFCCLNVFCYPLMAAGFWTRYNKGFATFDHLERERKRKPGDYDVRLLSADGDTITGILVEQKPTQLTVWQTNQFMHYNPAKYRLLTFHRLTSHHELKAIHLVGVTVDSLNHYLKRAVVKVTVQSEQEVYYVDGALVKKGNELTIEYPTGARFGQVAINNAQTRLELHQLELEHKAEQRRYQLTMAELERHHADLHIHTHKSDLSDYEEGKRREKVRELKEKIATFTQPEPVNTELYRVRKAMLEHKLREVARLNASLLIWKLENWKE